MVQSRWLLDTQVAQVAAWLAVAGSELKPVFTQAQQFLHALDPEAKFFSFRSFSDTAYTRHPGYDPLEYALHGSLSACWYTLARLNQAGAAVSVTINATDGRGRTPTHITAVRALFLDDDYQRSAPPVFALEPHLTVTTSPGHYHYYWWVRGLPTTVFLTWQRQLAKQFGGDSRVVALNQSMGLPGFWRRKLVTQPRQTQLLRISSHPAFSPAALSHWLAPPPASA